jgi:hypothetical protein
MRCGRSSSPGQVEQHHDALGLQDPVGQPPLRGAKARRPASIAQGGTGERSCWLRWDPPEGRRRCQRPSRPAGAGRRAAAGEPAASQGPGRWLQCQQPRPCPRPPLGSDRPGGCPRPGSAIGQAARPRALAARPAWASARSCRQRIGHPPGPLQLRTITQALWRPDVSGAAKRRPAYLGAVPDSCN